MFSLDHDPQPGRFIVSMSVEGIIKSSWDLLGDRVYQVEI